MKKIGIMLLFVSTITSAQQEFSKTLTNIETVVVKSVGDLILIGGTTNKLKISTKKNKHYKNNELLFESSEKAKKRKEKSKGLTPIFAGGKDNTNGLGFSISNNNKTLKIKDLKPHFKRSKVTMIIPKNVNVIIERMNLGNLNVKGFSSAVEAESNIGNIVMKEVTGPITAHANIGDIDITFVKVNQSAPITISSSVGEIDVAIPEKTNASLSIKTNGNVYTNFELKSKSEGKMRNISKKTIEGDINDGGVQIKLKSSVGNIYLRKKQN